MTRFVLLLPVLAACVTTEVSSGEKRNEADATAAAAKKPGTKTPSKDGGVASDGESATTPVSCTPPADPFTETNLRDGVSFLASKELDGRAPGSAGELAARKFIVDRFRCAGLTTFEQPFTNKGGTKTANVVGILPGSDPAVANDIIVVGSHFDHFGNGRLGANDNASGVMGMIAAAEALQAKKPRRTVAFVSFGSEETLSDEAPFVEGSAHFVANPPAEVPMNRVVYMINFDMIGSYTEAGNKVYAIGSMAGSPGKAILDGMNKNGLDVGTGEGGEEGASDGYTFCIAKIPYVFFWTDDPSCYHKACDTADRVDYANMTKIAKVGAELTAGLANATTDLAAFKAKSKVSTLGCTE